MLLAVCQLSRELLAMKTCNVIGVFRSIYCLLILLEDDLPGQITIAHWARKLFNPLHPKIKI